MRCTCENAIRESRAETWLEAAEWCREHTLTTTDTAAQATLRAAGKSFSARAAATLSAGGVKALGRYTEAPKPETAPSGPQDGATGYDLKVTAELRADTAHRDAMAAITYREGMAAITPIGEALDRAAARPAPGDARYWLRDGAGEQPGAAWPAADSGVGGA
jgi:hypothetical protein